MQKEIYEWVQGFEQPWKRDLFLRAAASAELSQTDVDEVTAMLLADDGAPEPREVTLDDLPGASDGHLPMSVDKLSELSNVNAINDNEVLEFDPSKINLIFGPNGAGKTGYCRILHHAGRSLNANKVLTNVLAKRTDPPAARIDVTVGGKPDFVQLDLSQPPAAVLGRVCCVDGKAVEIYLSKATEVDYAPASLASVTRLADGLRKVEAELNRRAELAEPAPFDLGAFGQAKVAVFLGNVSDKTTEEEIDALAKLSDEEKEQRSALRKQSGEIDAQNSRTLRETAEREAAQATKLADDLATLQSQLNDEAIKSLGIARAEVKKYRDAAQLAAEELEKSESLKDVGSDQWRVLWQAARDFAAHQGKEFPDEHDSARCPLCRQELGEEARDRLSRFDNFVKENVDSKLKDSIDVEKALVTKLPDVGNIRLGNKAALEFLTGDAKDGETSKLEEYLDRARLLSERLRENSDQPTEPLSSPPNEIQAFIEGREAEAKKHGDLEKAEGQEAIKRDLAELDARQKLFDERDAVIKHRDALKEVARLDHAKRETGTSSVSRKITSLSEDLVKADLQGALNRQLDALGFDGLEVACIPKTKAGDPTVKLRFKTIDDIPLSDVLSQGEQRRLALAMFLAEMEVLPGGNPIILDDPTSSIDQEGRKSIARTLVKLAENRQVIIFTHEMSFVYEVQRKAKSEPAIQHLLRIGKTTGHVQESLPWEGLSPKKRVPILEAELKSLGKTKDEGHPEDYARGVITFCARMRQAFERTVEDRVLAGVVTRREDDVHTKLLKNVRLSKRVVELVDEGMDENSPWLHDKAIADGSSPPSISELQQGIDIYKALQKELGKMETAQHKKVDLKPAEVPKAQEEQGSLALELVPDPEPEDSDSSPEPK